MKRGIKCHVNGLPGMKDPCMNSVCEGAHGQDEFNSGGTTFIPAYQDENTHVKQKFYHSVSGLLDSTILTDR